MNQSDSARLSRRHFGAMMLGGYAGLSLPFLRGESAWGATLGSSKTFNDGLPRSSPEAQGVSSQAILAFLDEVAAAKLELHSFMLYRHGHVVADGWWSPYRADRIQMMHSLTKSVTVCGVAHAMAEGRFGFDDKVISFFPDELPPQVDDKLAAMTVRDLLTMRTGHKEEVSGSVWRQIRTSWVAEFFKIPIVYQPGTTFVYTSAASFMLSAIITKTTGQRLRDYLEPIFFKPLGISGFTWDLGPGGINPGGNGLSWKTSDILKLGALHVRNGEWNGKQLLPKEWVKAATQSQVTEGKYGYQWWMGPDNAYYALGLFTQMSIVFPQHDAVLAITAAIDGSRKLLPSVWKAFPAAFSEQRDASAASFERLRARTSKLKLLEPLGTTASPLAQKISGRTYQVAKNEDDVTSVQLEFKGGHCLFSLTDDRGTHRIDVGLRDWIEGDTTMTGNKLHHQYQPDSMRVIAGARWIDDRTFEMTWLFIESVFRDTVTCRFDGDGMTLDRSVNVNSAETFRPTLHGQAT
jgi:CubicO group peptidase (beta-lactamase class C family)